MRDATNLILSISLGPIPAKKWWLGYWRKHTVNVDPVTRQRFELDLEKKFLFKTRNVHI